MPRVTAALIALTLSGTLAAQPLTAAQQQRRTNCAYLWRMIAPWSAKPAIISHFIAEHERMGIGPEWPYSFCYGLSNFGLTIGKRVGPCYGPMDIRREWARACGFVPSDLRDPKVNITCHVREMALYHRKYGETGMALLARVFYPARPMYYRRWRPTWARMQRVLAEGYRLRRIGPTRAQRNPVAATVAKEPSKRKGDER